MEVGMMDLAHYEAARNGSVNDLPFKNIGEEGMSDVFHEVSPLGNSLLHVAASSGNKDITGLIVDHYPHLVTKKNAQGDTPLHVAARFGRLNTAIVLVSFAKQVATTSNAEDGLLRMKNDGGNTPLHNALMAIQFPICDTKTMASMKSFEFEALARYLISADSEMSYCQNKIGKSPLCMAVEFGNKEIVEYIMEALPASDDLYEQKLEGKSPVHVAIERRNLDMLRLIMKLKPRFFLIRDEKGNTPLHSAASQGYLAGVGYLLENNSYGAFERNKKGLYPLHVACKHGHIQVTKELIKKWPDPFELLTHKGQNILHVAAKSGKTTVVIFIIFILKKNNAIQLVYEVDKDGNTPMHLAAFRGHSLVVHSLMSKHAVRTVNYQGETARDLAEKHFLLLDSEIRGKQNIPLKVQEQPIGMKTVNAESSENSSNDEKQFKKLDSKRSKRSGRIDAMMTLSIFYVPEYVVLFLRCSSDRRRLINPSIKSKLLQKEDIRNRINNLLVVATLIVGAAFAVSVQVPTAGGGGSDAGSSNSNTISNKNQNKTKDIEKMLHSFAISDTWALNISTLAAFILCWAQLVDVTLASTLSWLAFGLLAVSLYSLNTAFSNAIKLNMISDTTFISFINLVQRIFGSIYGLNLGVLFYLVLSWNESSILLLYYILFAFRMMLNCLWAAFIGGIAKSIRIISKMSKCG